MFCLIDVTHRQLLARHDSFLALAALAWIQFANIKPAIVREYGRGQVEALGFANPDAWHAQMASRADLVLPIDARAAVNQALWIRRTDARPYALDFAWFRPIQVDHYPLPPHNFPFNRENHPYWIFFTEQPEH